MKKVYIICCNDSMELASLSKEGLQDKMEELAEEHYEKLASQGHLKKFRSQENESFKEYRQRFYWHIHDVELAEGSVDARIEELEACVDRQYDYIREVESSLHVQESQTEIDCSPSGESK